MKDKNTLYYGDNLDVLRRHVAGESVDLVYLDPPFKSNQDYNVLFQEKDGSRAASQIKAFEDTWEWNLDAEAAYIDVVQGGGRPSQVMQAFLAFLGKNDLMAYLAMMAPRLLELHRVLKPTGSIYLHCDPAASHYLKILMDAVFSPQNFRSEVIWKRTSAHNSAKRFGPVHDTILFYTKTDSYTWNEAFLPLPQETLDAWYNNVEAETGRRFNRADLTAAGVRTGESGATWRGINVTAKGRLWAIPGFVGAVVAGKSTLDALDALDAAGRLHWPKKASGMPMLKRYVEESRGVPAQDVITDINPLNNATAERLGYPTQKPEALLERLIKASSNEGDTVLDPFCGCGTAIHAAQRLGRRWVGIDVTHLAVALIRKRLLDAFDKPIETTYDVIGEPTSLPDAATLAKQDHFQFQCWCVGKLGASPLEHKKGADRGIDGRIYFVDDVQTGKANQVIFSVKGGHIKPGDVRDLRGVIDREKAAIGVYVCLEAPTREIEREVASAGFYEPPFGTAKYRASNRHRGGYHRREGRRHAAHAPEHDVQAGAASEVGRAGRRTFLPDEE